MALDMKKFMGRFVEEARDHVTKLNEGLVRLENHPEDAETIDAVFRSAHTIKGSARMMKLTSIAEVAHKMEDALGALREKKLGYSRDLADVLFKGIDCIASMIEEVASGKEIVADTTVLRDELTKAAEGLVDAASGASPEGSRATTLDTPVSPDAGSSGRATGNAKINSPDEAPPKPKIDRVAEVPHSPEARETRPRPSESIRVNAEQLDELIRLMGEIVSNQNRLKRRLEDVRDTEKFAKHSTDLMASLEGGESSSHDREREIIQSGRTLQTRLKQLASSMRDDANLQELLTTELQAKALILRMVPLSTVFDSLPRMVRDVARSQGKDVELVIEGGDIGLDKKMVEKIGDPLVHMLRNSVDHGIESPDERRKAGKREQGTLKLSASYDAGNVVIELSDDGGGIPLDKIREKALRKKMFTEEELNSMPEPQIIDLIYHPGFSTSAIITDISGRGVGMDVVKRNVVEELKGSIKTTTKAGRGTSFAIRLPMTLAVMRVLQIEASGMTFAVSAHYVIEIIRVPGTEIINVLNKKAIRLREELIPVANLSALLRLGGRSGAKKVDPLILIARVGSEKLGLVIDSLLDEEDMVIKTLPAHMKNLPLVSGVTISGRNEIINILHVPGLIKAAGEMEQVAGVAEAGHGISAHILVVDDSVNTREIEKSILEAYGYAVDLAEDGIEAMEKTKTTKYDLVITDVEMPRLDGFSLTERLRNDDSYKDTPIIIMTSREKETDKKRGILVGANAYIVKGGFDQASLLETVQNLVG